MQPSTMAYPLHLVSQVLVHRESSWLASTEMLVEKLFGWSGAKACCRALLGIATPLKPSKLPRVRKVEPKRCLTLASMPASKEPGRKGDCSEFCMVGVLHSQ